MRPSFQNLGLSDPLSGLVAGVLRGESKDTDSFLRAISPAMLRIIRQLLGINHPDIPDLLQDASFAVIDALPRFRGESSVLHFACRVATLTSMNARRRLQLRARYSMDGVDLDACGSSESSPLGFAVSERRREAFRQLLDELPVPQSEALVMHCILGWTIDEAAAMTGVPPNTVRSRLIAAKAALKHKIEQSPVLWELLKGAS